jgi:hypothetical protein
MKSNINKGQVTSYHFFKITFCSFQALAKEQSNTEETSMYIHSFFL